MFKSFLGIFKFNAENMMQHLHKRSSNAWRKRIRSGLGSKKILRTESALGPNRLSAIEPASIQHSNTLSSWYRVIQDVSADPLKIVLQKLLSVPVRDSPVNKSSQQDEMDDSNSVLDSTFPAIPLPTPQTGDFSQQEMERNDCHFHPEMHDLNFNSESHLDSSALILTQKPPIQNELSQQRLEKNNSISDLDFSLDSCSSMSTPFHPKTNGFSQHDLEKHSEHEFSSDTYSSSYMSADPLKMVIKRSEPVMDYSTTKNSLLKENEMDDSNSDLDSSFASNTPKTGDIYQLEQDLVEPSDLKFVSDPSESILTTTTSKTGDFSQEETEIDDNVSESESALTPTISISPLPTPGKYLQLSDEPSLQSPVDAVNRSPNYRAIVNDEISGGSLRDSNDILTRNPEDFKLMRYISSGAFGDVFEAEDRHSREIV